MLRRLRLARCLERCIIGQTAPISTQASLPLFPAIRSLGPPLSNDHINYRNDEWFLLFFPTSAGEKARRRDPRVFPYQAIPCPEFRKGNCKRGDGCPFAHGVFECWLHPSRYRTQLCKEGTACARSICFFAHTVSQLREPSQPAIHLTPVITTMPRKDKSATIKAGACAGAGCTSGDGSSSRPGSPGSTLHGGVTPSSCATSRCASPGATAAAEIALRQVFAAKSEGKKKRIGPFAPRTVLVVMRAGCIL